MGDRLRDDRRQLKRQNKEDDRGDSADDARIEGDLFDGELLFIAAHIDQTVSPYDDIEHRDKDGAEKPSVVSEQLLLQRQRHKAAVGEDHRKLQNLFAADVLAAEHQPAQYDRSADDGAGGECRNADLTENLHREIALKRGDHDARGDDIQNDIRHHLGGVLRDHALFAADEADGD